MTLKDLEYIIHPEQMVSIVNNDVEVAHFREWKDQIRYHWEIIDIYSRDNVLYLRCKSKKKMTSYVEFDEFVRDFYWKTQDFIDYMQSEEDNDD